ncbi:hypothetical protein [Streptomyces lutosisoli]|uniref:DUF2970 domain-containing protein n=1 Tax=Streptomyces lutosisoli TaxID=2665721 RepID=A0ABW2VVH7_9ACTN
MSYLITGFVGVFAGVRALGLRRRQLSAAAGPSSALILRPAVLAVLAGIAIAGGIFLLAGGVLVLVQG